MDFDDLKNKSEKELKELLMEQSALQRELRFKVVNQQLKTVHKVKEVRKNIARIKMLINTKNK